MFEVTFHVFMAQHDGKFLLFMEAKISKVTPIQTFPSLSSPMRVSAKPQYGQIEGKVTILAIPPHD